MEKNSLNLPLPLLGFIFGLSLQVTILLIDAYSTYGELSLNVLKVQQKNNIHLFLDLFPFICLLLAYLLNKKYNSYIDKLEKINYTNTTESTKHKIQEKNDNNDDLHKKTLRLQKENFIKSKLLNESYVNIKTKIDEITSLAESIDNIEVIKNLSNEINTQLMDMNDYIKLDSNEIKLSNKNINLINVVENIVDNIYPQAKKREIDLFYYINPNTPDLIIIDNIYLSKILEKLLTYSINTTKKGYVFLSVTAEKKQTSIMELKILIENTSAGVEDNKVVWGDNTATNTDYIISDLSLILCKKWSELLNGKLWLESTLGKGTSFFLTFELPISKTSYKAKENLSSLENKKIVLLDQKEFSSNLFKLYFDRYDSDLTTIKSLEDPFDNNIDLFIINDRFEDRFFEKFSAYLIENNFPILVICNTSNSDFINKIEEIDNFHTYKNNKLFFFTSDFIKETPFINIMLRIFNRDTKEVNNTEKTTKYNDIDEELIDFNVILNLKEISDEDNNLFNDIVSDFQEEIPILLEKLKLNVKNSNKELSLDLIKRIEGPSINLGAKKLFKVCELAQDSIQKSDFDKTGNIIFQIESIYELSLKKLKNY